MVLVVEGTATPRSTAMMIATGGNGGMIWANVAHEWQGIPRLGSSAPSSFF